MRTKILRILNEAIPGIDVEESDSLIDDGIIDSITLSAIIAEICIDFQVDIPIDEMTTKNFNSIDNMLEMIQRCIGDRTY